jgi:GNAT superfamily N-acetyltransferase
MRIALRRAVRDDIPSMHVVRRAVRENPLSSNVIREEHYIPAIESTGRGWVVEEDGVVVAFAVGNAETGNVWALFVHPDHEGKGYGKKLQDAMVQWLFNQGLSRVYLSTAPGTRAQGFYEATGWKFMGVDSHGEATYERHAPVDS